MNKHEIHHEEILRLLYIIDRDAEDLTSLEADFVADLIDRDVQVFAAREAARIKRIYQEKVL